MSYSLRETIETEFLDDVRSIVKQYVKTSVTRKYLMRNRRIGDISWWNILTALEEKYSINIGPGEGEQLRNGNLENLATFVYAKIKLAGKI